MAGLKLVNHGGLCCGVKTIYGFGYGDTKSGTQSKLPKREQDNRDSHGQDVSSDTPFFTDEAPAETTLERLHRYIAFMKKRRPGNLVEVCLAAHPSGGQWCDQTPHWAPTLLELGFREVSKFKNSNSGNVVTVFHLTIAEKTSLFDPLSDDDDVDDSSDYPEDDEEYDD